MSDDVEGAADASSPHIEADLVVIGFGKGGKTLAAALGRQGWRVVMIEQSAEMYGGTCINVGCVPTKSLVYQAEQVIDSTSGADAYRRGGGGRASDDVEHAGGELRHARRHRLGIGDHRAGPVPGPAHRARRRSPTGVDRST